MKYQVSFPMKTSYLHMWRDHRRYGYIINRAFESKLIWYFTGVYIINRILHSRCMDMNFIFSCSTWDLMSECSEQVRYRVDHSKIKFISTRGHEISAIIRLLDLVLLRVIVIAYKLHKWPLKDREVLEDWWGSKTRQCGTLLPVMDELSWNLV